MSIKLYVCFLGALLLSAPASAGIYEGNPGLTLRLSGDAKVLAADAWLDEVTLFGCDGSKVTVVVAEEVDLVDGITIEVPRGLWCEVEVAVMDLDIELAGLGWPWPASEDAVVMLERTRSAPRAAVFRGAVLDRDDLILHGIYEGNPPGVGGITLH